MKPKTGPGMRYSLVRAALLVATVVVLGSTGVVGALVGPGSAPSAAEPAALSAPDCAGPVLEDTPAGRACPTKYGGWRTFFDDGTSQLFHVDAQFTDVGGIVPPVLSPGAEGASHTARAPMCVADPTTEYHNYALYVQPSDAGASNYSTKVSTIRTRINEINGWLRSESSDGFSKMVDYRFRCAGAGDTTVSVAEVRLTIGSGVFSPSIQYADDVVNDLKALGYDSVYAKYWIFMDANPGGTCAWGFVPADDEQGNVNNLNNVGPGYASFLNNCWTLSTVMHEVGHTYGAVQAGAPNSNYAATGQHHCTDQQDIMCYNYPNVCTTRLTHKRWDCNSNDYFHPGAPTGYLATNWNIGATYHRFLLNQRDCGKTADAPGAFGDAYVISLPQTNCSGALNKDGGEDADDWYKFSVNSGQVIEATVTPNSQANYNLCIWKPTQVSASCSNTGGLGGTETATFTADSTGSWRVRVFTGNGVGNGLYTLSMCLDC